MHLFLCFRELFNNWIQISTDHLDGKIYADPLLSSRYFYLINLLNCFGAFNGFDLLQWFTTQYWANINVCFLNAIFIYIIYY